LLLSLSLALPACGSDRPAPAPYPQPYPPQPNAPYAGPPPPAPTALSPAPSSAASPGCSRPPPHAGALAHRADVAGRARSYIVVVPDGYSPASPHPVVFVLHGGGGNAQGARTQTDLERVAAGRAVFVYPDAVNGNWDLDSPAAKNADIALFDTILLTLHNALCVDPKRVFLTGFSNGAYMANQIACRRGERVRGVVTHAGGGPYETSGTYDAQGHLVCPGKAVAALSVHGQGDRVVAVTEGDKSLAHWSFANRCAASTTSAWLAPCTAQQGCVQPVGSCRVPGLGHGLWKEAGKVTWAFFDALR